MEEPHPLDDPDRRRRVVRTLLVTGPLLFAGCYVLAWLQGAAPTSALIIALVALAMCVATAGVIAVMGSKSWIALVAVKIALLLVRR